MLFKVHFESITIPSSVTDETDFMVILPIYNLYESAFPRIINRNLSGFAFIGVYTDHSYTFYVFCVRVVNVSSKFIPQE